MVEDEPPYNENGDVTNTTFTKNVIIHINATGSKFVLLKEIIILYSMITIFHCCHIIHI